jgi:hypothetical protein
VGGGVVVGLGGGKKVPKSWVLPLVDPKTREEVHPSITDPSLHTCFARISLSPAYGILSLDPKDVQGFRKVARRHLGLGPNGEDLDREDSQQPQESFDFDDEDTSIAAGCPPKRVLLLRRPDRRVLNSDQLRELLKAKWGLELEEHSVSALTPSREQMKLFATAGLILSSHSSQLINVLFSHPAQALIEIAPEFYNVDFSAYAHAMGLHFNYAIGGSIPISNAIDPLQMVEYTYVSDPLMLSCVTALQSECPGGDSWCITQRSPEFCSKITQWPNKQMNFHANLTAITIAMQQALGHIQDKCFGKWLER